MSASEGSRESADIGQGRSAPAGLASFRSTGAGATAAPGTGDAATGSMASGEGSFGLEFSGANDDFVGGPLGRGDPLIGTVVGGVHIDSLVDRGGMGAVYTGKHLKLGTEVAVKFVRREIASARALERFWFEAKVLATLDHAGIVRVRHADTAIVDGVETPFIVMDKVHGAQQLDEFASGRAIAERKWMQLFQRVCEAVAAAHAKGVVHRDLKPGNILVTVEGEKPPQPHVIDFGIALVRDPSFSEAQPAGKGPVGTPAYMSPEQARGELDSIDVTSDVYSLGVVMFEAVGGRMPYAFPPNADMAAVAHVINHTPPLRLDEARPGTSRDLHAIVMKCLAKQQDERYSSAAELAADIRRFIADEAIVAAPPTAYDTARRFCRRHRALATAAAAILATLVGALLVVSAFFMQSERRRKDMEVAERVAREERGLSDELVGTVARALLGGSRPRDAIENAARREFLLVTARGVIGQVSKPNSRQAAVQARVLCAIGDALIDIGQPRDARELFLEARNRLGSPDDGDDRTYADCLGRLAYAAVECGEFTEAIEAGERAAAVWARQQGPLHPGVPQLRSTVAMARMSLGDLDQAAETYAWIEDGLSDALPELDRDLAAALTNHGEILCRQERFEPAEARHRKAISIWARQPEHDDAREGVAFNNLGEVLRQTGDYAEAEECHRRALEIHRRLLPPGHFLIATGLSKLGELRREQKTLDEAEKLFSEALEIREAAGLGDGPEAALLLWRLALVHNSAGRAGQAVECLKRCIDIRTKRLGPDHPDTRKAQSMAEQLSSIDGAETVAATNGGTET